MANVALSAYIDWIGTHGSEADAIAQQGLGVDPATGLSFIGPRAVWEHWIADKTTVEQILLDGMIDPIVFVGGVLILAGCAYLSSAARHEEA